jgi:ABC transport system ATP-binding/permease protein
MEILTAIEVSLKYNNAFIFEDLTFSIRKGAKIGLVGINGSGKSSLCRILSQHIEPDQGEVRYAKDLTKAYISQEFKIDSDITAHDYLYQPLEDQDVYKAYLLRLQNLLPLFTIENLETQVQLLSGGQQRQLELIRVLALEPQLLLLDEPTNHLDLVTLINLQTILSQYPGTILMISHDRYFVDQFVDEIWELDRKKLHSHSGNYSDYLEAKEKRQQKDRVEYERRKQELKRELEWVRAGVKARGTKDQGRMKRYFELKAFHEKHIPHDKKLYLPLPKPAPLGNKILAFEDLEIEFPHKKEPKIVTDLNFRFEEGMRLGILGPNGSGKTTFLQTVLGKRKKSGGKLIYGLNTDFNYQDQKRMEIDDDKSILDIISEGNIEMKFGGTKMNVYAYLKKFLFTPDDLKKTIGELSGGQRARVLLAKILKEGGNFLILDEPTNDIDVDTMQALENSLLDFPGCIMLVSHDRFFLDKVCTHVLALEGEGNFTLSQGGYSAYMNKYGDENDFWQKRLQIASKTKVSLNQAILEKPSGPSSKEVRIAKSQQRKLEKQIAEISQEISTKEKVISEPGFFSKKADYIKQHLAQLEGLRKKKELLETEWLSLEV